MTTSSIEPAPAAPSQSGTEPLFFPVSVAKLIVLSIFTIGLYQFYWFYKNWCLIRQHEKSDISPFWRTFFVYFYCHALFRRVREQQVRLEGSSTLAVDVLAAGWIVASLVCLLPDPYLFLTLASVLFMVPVQRTAERLNARVAPNHDRNGRMSAGNWAAVILGGLLLMLMVIASMMLTIPTNVL